MPTPSLYAVAVEQERLSSSIEWVPIKEAALRLGVHQDTIRSWISKGWIEARRFGPKIIRINWATVDELGEGVGLMTSRAG